jgi:hypothetical protein
MKWLPTFTTPLIFDLSDLIIIDSVRITVYWGNLVIKYNEYEK